MPFSLEAVNLTSHAAEASSEKFNVRMLDSVSFASIVHTGTVLPYI